MNTQFLLLDAHAMHMQMCEYCIEAAEPNTKSSTLDDKRHS